MMFKNYTPLPTFYQSKKNSNNFFVVLFFLGSIFFLIYSIIWQPQKQPLKKTSQANEIKKLANLQYQYLYEINFPISRINNQLIDTKKFLEEAKKIYPNLNEKEIVSEFNYQLFSFWALTDYFNQPFIIPSNFQTLITKVDALKNQYLEDSPLYSGYLIKIRYKGYYGESQEKINNLFPNKEIKIVAEEKIKNLINKNINLDQLKKEIESDEEIKALNNGEKALINFEKNDLYPPFFDDPDFCLYLDEAPLNQYSKIFELKTLNREKNAFEDYAYMVFYLTEKENNNQYLDCLINQKIKDYRL